jgi:hypothetical protein
MDTAVKLNCDGFAIAPGRETKTLMLMLCPICAEEFLKPVVVCSGCGCNLVPGSLDPEADELFEAEKRPVEFVELCRPRSFPVAMLIKQTLEQNGVVAIVHGGHSLSVLPHLAFGGEMRVLVDSERLDYARTLYRAYFESEDSDFSDGA